MCMLVYLRLDMGYPTCVLVCLYVMHGVYNMNGDLSLSYTLVIHEISPYILGCIRWFIPGLYIGCTSPYILMYLGMLLIAVLQVVELRQVIEIFKRPEFNPAEINDNLHDRHLQFAEFAINNAMWTLPPSLIAAHISS